MFRTSTVNFSADAAQAVPHGGIVDLGELSPEALIVLLEGFRGIATQHNNDSEPHILVTGRSGKFLVRTGQGKLYLYNARDSIEPYAELTSDEIVAQLERTAITEAPFSGSSATSTDTPHRSAPHRGIAAAILVTGLALNGYTLYSVFYTQTVNEKPAITLVTDASELAARQRDLVGTYHTGDQPGDRLITIQPDGHVKFVEIGSKNSLVNNTDTFRLGRRANILCLTTAESGVIDIVDAATLVYYRDTYKRR